MSEYTEHKGGADKFWDKYCISTRTGNPVSGEKKHELSASKARKILHDKSVRGHPLSEKQRKFFGAISSGEKPYK